jgi:hypothetical protein
MGQHHAIAGYELATNRFTKLLVGYFIPTVECHAAFGHQWSPFLATDYTTKRHIRHKIEKGTSAYETAYVPFVPFCG